MFQRGGMSKYRFVANLLPSISAKKIENRLIFDEVMGRVCCLVFLTQSVYWQLQVSAFMACCGRSVALDFDLRDNFRGSL